MVATKPQAYERNRIGFLIDQQADREGGETTRDALRQQISEELSITRRLAQIINNTAQPTLQEAFVIAQVLNVSLDELCAPQIPRL